MPISLHSLYSDCYLASTVTFCTYPIKTLDGRDIKQSLSLSQLRAQLGLVQQEPALFERSVRDNIAYGDNSRPVPLDEVIHAAKQANVHDFIASLPLVRPSLITSCALLLNNFAASNVHKRKSCSGGTHLQCPPGEEHTVDFNYMSKLLRAQLRPILNGFLSRVSSQNFDRSTHRKP